MYVLSVHTVTSIVFLRRVYRERTVLKFDKVLCTQTSHLPILVYSSKERMLQTRDNALCHLRATLRAEQFALRFQPLLRMQCVQSLELFISAFGGVDDRKRIS